MNYRNLIEKVDRLCVTSDENRKKYAEVFTPWPLINKMLDPLPPSDWSDLTKTFLDPCAGKGNMPAVIITRLMEGLKDVIMDEEARYRHIIENQIYMAEYQRQSARDIASVFNPENRYRLNLYVGDFLRMPPFFLRCRTRPESNDTAVIVIEMVHRLRK